MQTTRKAATKKTLAVEMEKSDGRRIKIDLNGAWQRVVNGHPLDVITVPSSQKPIGIWRLTRDFVVPALEKGRAALLHFEAITYHAVVWVNGEKLGDMGPYVPYEFNISACVKPGKNVIEVEICDLLPAAAPEAVDDVTIGENNGWEARGGIIRDVYIELCSGAHINNVRFAYQLNAAYSQAACQAKVFVSSSQKTSGRLACKLFRNGACVAQSTANIEMPPNQSEHEMAFKLATPDLWSPETPCLYTLEVTLSSDFGEDQFTCHTGFRHVVIKGNRFFLNGRPLILNGVCRHDMWKDQGFTLSRAQMAQDMAQIKALGANFVRLVHYPHHRHMVELADQLGLFVTEEPGYTWFDFRAMKPSLMELGLRIMERVIRRDWNSPAVFAWLLGNESHFTADYLRRGKALCRGLDPIQRPVSAAVDVHNIALNKVFEEANMDFFTIHPYTNEFNYFREAAAHFGPSRPLVFTEWGGKGFQAEFEMSNAVDVFLELIEKGLLAGHSYWSWQDLPEYCRVDAEMSNGVLESGVVTEDRRPRDFVTQSLSALFHGQRLPQRPPEINAALQTPWQTSNRLVPLDLQRQAQSAPQLEAWQQLEAAMGQYWSTNAEAMHIWNQQTQWKRTGKTFGFWQSPVLQIRSLDIPLAIIDHKVRPLVLAGDKSQLSIPVNMECVRLHFLGNVTLPSGWPVQGTFGAPVASYTLHYADGATQEIPLRHGIELARANTIFMSSRIQPLATAAQPAVHFVKDAAREQYQVLLHTVPVKGRKLERITWKLLDTALAPVLFAIVVEQTPV